MPDRDKIHERLPRRYWRVYDQIIEWQFTPQVLADEVLCRYKDDVKKYGDAPIGLIFQVAEAIAPAITEPLLAPDWRELSMTIDTFAGELDASPRVSDLARRACKEQLAELRADEMPDDLPPAMVLKYLIQIYDSSFEGAVPQTTHPNGVTHDEIVFRLRAIRPFIIEQLKALARQITDKRTVQRLRLPKRLHKTIVEKETDLETIGR